MTKVAKDTQRALKKPSLRRNIEGNLGSVELKNTLVQVSLRGAGPGPRMSSLQTVPGKGDNGCPGRESGHSTVWEI